VQGIRIHGRADRIDRNTAGELAVIDYKTGAPPTGPQVAAGFALQLGLLAGLIEGETGTPVTALSFWKLGGGKEPGKASDPLSSRGKPVATVAEHIASVRAHFDRLCEDYLLGDKAFTAKLHPEFAARYSDYDHLARVAEWQARPRPVAETRGATRA